MRIGLDAGAVFRNGGLGGGYSERLAERMSAFSPRDEYFLYHWDREGEPVAGWLLRENVVVRTVSRRSLPARVRADKIDVFHGTDMRRLARGRFGNVLTIHDVVFHIQPGGRGRRLQDRIDFMRLTRDAWLSDRVIAFSESSARDIVRHVGVGWQKVRVIPLAPGEEFRPDADGELRRALLARIGVERPRYVLSSGPLDPRQNLLLLLEAYMGLRGQFPDLGVILAGSPGWKSEEITGFIRAHDLSREVKVTGPLGPRELAALCGGASIFVMPSFCEEFGLTPLDAMACGVPVIVSAGGSLPELVGDAAVVLPSDDTEGFRREIARVLANGKWAGVLRAKGAAHAAKYTWDRTAAETLTVYRELAR